MNHHHGNNHRKKTESMFQGRNFILKGNNVGSLQNVSASSNIRKSSSNTEKETSYLNSRRERLETLIVPAASPSSPEIIFNLAPKLMDRKTQESSTSCFPIETLKESEFKFVTPKSRVENASTACPSHTSGGVSSTIGDIITPSLLEAIYEDMTPINNSTKSTRSRSEMMAQPNCSPELSIGSLPSDILSSPENTVSSPPLFASRLDSSDTTNSSYSSSSPTASPKKKKVKLNDRSFDGEVDFNLVSQESKFGPEKTLVENFDIHSHSRVFAFEFRLNDLSCEIEEIVCIELLKNGNDFQETGIRFCASIIQKADVDGNGKSYLTDAITNLSRLIYSNSFFNEQSPKIVTRSHGKKMEMLLDTLQNIIISDIFNSYSFLNNLYQLLSEQIIYLYESFKDNIKPLCNEQEILSHFSIGTTTSNWICQTCSMNNATVCSLVECTTTSLLFQRMFPVIEKKRSQTLQLLNVDHNQQLDDSLNIDYEEVLHAIKTPPNNSSPKTKTNSNRTGKKISKIKISPRGIISASNNSNKEFKKSLQLALRSSPKKSKSTIPVPVPEKENAEIIQPVEKVQFIPPQRMNQTSSPCNSSTVKLTIVKKSNPPIDWNEQKVEELLTPKTVAIMHFFSTCRQKNLDSFFKSPKSSMILQMRPFLSIKDLVNKFSEHPCLGLTNLVQFCKTTFGV